MCKERGLRISGSKTEVVIRLMEDDESKSPQQVSIGQSNPQQISIGQSNPQQYSTQVIHISNNSKSIPILFGLAIVIYGLFRSYVGVMFMQETQFQSLIAISIGMCYIACGITTMQGFREGIYGTLGVLVVSGVFAVAFHNDFGPLSIGLGEGIIPIEWTLCCSGSCMLIVAIPLMVASDEFSEGRPPIMNLLIGTPVGDAADILSTIQKAKSKAEPNTTTEKIVISCPHCDKPLKVPSNFSGNVRCPMCKEKFQVK